MPDPTHNTKNQEIKMVNMKINFKNNKIILSEEWVHLIKSNNCLVEKVNKMIPWFLGDIYK